MAAKKSQSSIEFMILIGFLLFSFTIFFAFIYENISNKNIENNNKKVLEVANIIREEVEFAYQSSDGYYRVFEIPSNINNLDYQINITDNFVYIRTENKKYAASIPIKEISHTGSSQLIKGYNVVEKINGEIFINRNGQ